MKHDSLSSDVASFQAAVRADHNDRWAMYNTVRSTSDEAW